MRFGYRSGFGIRHVLGNDGEPKSTNGVSNSDDERILRSDANDEAIDAGVVECGEDERCWIREADGNSDGKYLRWT